jgi:aspartyl-tRNA(Asn)/glutamyl-tRNA(Gln) amidotransferase subunit C
VRRIAALARLDLTDAELERVAGQLRSVLDHVAALEEAGAEPHEEGHAAAPTAGREDVVAPDPLAFPLAGMAPGFVEGFFSVPRLRPFAPRPAAPGPSS